MAIPKVTVTNVGKDAPESKWDRWSAECECGWAYSNIAKTDVQQSATRHRGEHRARLAERGAADGVATLVAGVLLVAFGVLALVVAR